jgi:hypothetical protein
MRQALERVEEATTPTQVLPCATERTRIRMHSMTRGMLVGHRREAGPNKSSHYDHRLVLCAVDTLLARSAGHALRPHCDRKCRSTEIIMCTVGLLLVHESKKSRSTEKIKSVPPIYGAIWYAEPLREDEERSKRKIMICHNKTFFVGF